jgi:hypothetical protein
MSAGMFVLQIALSVNIRLISAIISRKRVSLVAWTTSLKTSIVCFGDDQWFNWLSFLVPVSRRSTICRWSAMLVLNHLSLITGVYPDMFMLSVIMSETTVLGLLVIAAIGKFYTVWLFIYFGW